MTETIVVLVTVGSDKEAQKISKALVEAKLVACVNAVPSIQSIFRWQGKMCEDSEILLIAKSVKDKLPGIIKKVKELHSYDVPEIIALPIIGGSEDYLNWLVEETNST